MVPEIDDVPKKPAFAVPFVSEVAALPKTGLTVASSFAGCGGSSLGHRMAGFRVVWASEFVEAARDSYRANADARTVIDGRDVREVMPDEVLTACGLSVGELDLLDGSPPCSSFSTAGRREEGWGQVKAYSDKEQRTDDLFSEFVRLLRGIRPRTFVAENVSGLVKGVAKGHFLGILADLKASGYRVSCRVLDAQWLGVPQVRKRTIFVGVREDLADAGTGEPLLPRHPDPLPFGYSVREALPWLDRGARQGGNVGFGKVAFVGTDRPSGTIGAGPCSGNGRCGPGTLDLRHVEPESDMTGYAVGHEADRLSPGQQSERYFSLVRAPLNGPSPTVTVEGMKAHAASVMHPTERRKFSIAELRRICAFPDDFVLTGTYQQQWERLGRAVPPVMMALTSRVIRDLILFRADGREPWPGDPVFVRRLLRHAKLTGREGRS